MKKICLLIVQYSYIKIASSVADIYKNDNNKELQKKEQKKWQMMVEALENKPQIIR